MHGDQKNFTAAEIILLLDTADVNKSAPTSD
jgi:hypothetical protein